MRRIIGLAALVWSLAASPALADSNTPSETQTDVGLFTAIITGSHVSSGTAPETGVVPGAALELTQHVDRFRLHLEGIPTVAATASGSGPFGGTSASLDLLNATAMVDIDAQRRLRIGAGFQLVNLTNHDGNDGQRNAVRIASPIFAAGATLPLPSAHFVELNLMVDPNLRGNLLVFDPAGQSLPTLPEEGAEVDYSAAYGWRHKNVEYLLGGRGLSYHTRNINNGQLVDRNVGGGVTFEVRFLLNH